MNSHCKYETTHPDITFVGVDVSKNHLDSFIPGAGPRRDANTPQGIAALLAALLLCSHPRVVCEATGGYEKKLASALMDAGVGVCIVQPGRVRHFARAEGLLAKTDAVDARLLSRFGQSIRKIRCAVPVCPQTVRLRQILEARRMILELVTEVKGRLELAEGYLREEVEAQLAALGSRLVKVEADLAEHLGRCDELRQKSERLQLVKGVGPVLAATLLAYVPELGKVEDRVLSSLVGVAPHPEESGGTRGRRHIQGGRSEVRKVLYMAAVSAARCNEILRTFYRRLRDESHKKPKVALVAVMRKLLRVLNRLMADPSFSLA